MTRGISLRTWDEIGTFEREVALYRALNRSGVKLSLVSCGGSEDLNYAARLPGVDLLCNRWSLPVDWYVRLIPLIHARPLWRADFIKTNQMKGAELALKAARLWRKPLLARCGYMWSVLASASGKHEEARAAGELERRVFRKAAAIVVTTEAMKADVRQRCSIEEDRIHVVPNYVLTDVFIPGGRSDATHMEAEDGGNSVPPSREQSASCGARRKVVKILFVGRLSEEKNPQALLMACAALPVKLVMAGEGPLRSTLESTARDLGVDVGMPGYLPHEALPKLCQESDIFVLPSPHEGHPKTLIEAMSCGMAVIGSNVPGIREVIRHEVTGLLCGTDPESIRASIVRLMNDPVLRGRLGVNARKFAVENYSLEKIVEMELAVYRKVVGGEGERGDWLH